jgi:hypothetical protein
MNRLHIEPTTTAQWHSLVSEAQESNGIRLDETLESYLVFLLSRFMQRAELGSQMVALDFLDAMQSRSEQRATQLRDVGDQCLLLSGLFPQVARRRMVTISYFIDLGRTAYAEISDCRRDARKTLYEHLAQEFVLLMDVLQAMREASFGTPLSPLEAFELLQPTQSGHTHSRSALRALAAYTDAAPLLAPYYGDSTDRRH